MATLSVFLYFGTSLFAAQYLIPQEEYLDRETFPHLPGDFRQHRLKISDEFISQMFFERHFCLNSDITFILFFLLTKPQLNLLL